MLNKWDDRWLNLAKFVSEWSKDPSTKVGSVIANGKQLISLGYNGFPSTCPDKLEWYTDRTTKYKLVTHAEVNAILNAKLPVNEGTLFVTPLFPCVTCATLICSAGIKRVVYRVSDSVKSDFLNTLEDVKFVFKANGVIFFNAN